MSEEQRPNPEEKPGQADASAEQPTVPQWSTPAPPPPPAAGSNGQQAAQGKPAARKGEPAPIKPQAVAASVGYDDEEEVEEGPTGATILAALAFIASVVALLGVIGIIPLGGSKQVTSSELASGSVEGDKIADGSIGPEKLDPDLAAVLANPQKGPRGPKGEPGPRGPKGPAGPAGPSGLAKTELVSKRVTVEPGTASATATAICAGNQKLVSGGVQLKPTTMRNVAITASAPNDDQTGWTVATRTIEPVEAEWSLTAYAWCADKEQAKAAKGQGKGGAAKGQGKGGAAKGQGKGGAAKARGAGAKANTGVVGGAEPARAND